MEWVFDRLSQILDGSAEFADATDSVTRWLAINPLNERAHQRLIRLYLAAGDQSAALRAYGACRALLEKELRAAPAPETEALAERARASQSRGAEHQRAAPRARPPSSQTTGPLVGRAAEFTHLVEVYHAVRQGQPRVVVIQGEAGIGKTRLATEFLGRAVGAGADILQGRAFETGGRIPYQPLVDELRPRLERENAPDNLLDDIWLAELSRLLPELRERYPDLPPLPTDEVTARTRLYEAVARLGQALAQRAPLVLFVDDVQWADAASLDVLRYASRRWTESGTTVMLLLCLRSEALAAVPSVGEWLAGLERDVSLTRFDLGPLNFQDTRHYVRALGNGHSGAEPEDATRPELEDFAHWLFKETGGQPFFMIEMLRVLLDRGIVVPREREQGGWALDPRFGETEPARLRGLLPPGVRQVISARLARLTSTARTLLTAGAILGPGFTFEQVGRVADVSENAALQAIDEVLRAHLVREAGGNDGGVARYFFSHDKIRDAVYAETGVAWRRVFHRRALKALSTASAAELAHHALSAGLERTAVDYSLRAGEDAMRVLAARDAIVHFERAMTIAERNGWSELLTDARSWPGRAFANIAQWADAKRDLEAALEALGAGETGRRAKLLVTLSEACWWLLDIPEVRRYATEAATLGEQLGQIDLEIAARGWLAGADGADGDPGSGIAQFERVVARADHFGVSLPAHHLMLHSLALYWTGRLEDSIERSRVAVEAARGANDASVTMYTLPQHGLSLAARGRYDEALPVFAEARRFGQEYRIDTLLARSIALSTGFHLDLFDFEGAEALSHEARELALKSNFSPSASSAGIDLLLNFARRGDVARAERLVDEVAGVVEAAAGFHGWLWRLRLAEARAELALARGQQEEAIGWSTEAIDQSRLRRRLKYQVIGLGTRASGLIALNRTREALVDFRYAVALARGLGDPALFLRAAAWLLEVDGDDALATEAHAAVERIIGALPDEGMRRRFKAAEPVRLVSKT